MKTRPTIVSLATVAFAVSLLNSCEKTADRPTEYEGSPATQVSPSEPVPQPTTPDTASPEAEDTEEP